MAKVAPFTVSLSEALATVATVQYGTVPGTALDGADYTGTSGTLTFQPGDLSKTVEVPVLASPTANVDKSFTLVFNNASANLALAETSVPYAISAQTSEPAIPQPTAAVGTPLNAAPETPFAFSGAATNISVVYVSATTFYVNQQGTVENLPRVGVNVTNGTFSGEITVPAAASGPNRLGVYTEPTGGQLLFLTPSFNVATSTSGGTTPPVIPVFSVTAAPVTEIPAAAALLPLSGSGNQFVDSSGKNVRMHGINWYGYDGPDLIVHGLYAGRGYKDMIDQQKALGFDIFRLPFADDFVTSTLVFNGDSGNQYVDALTNPDIIGLTPLQAMDAIIYYCATVGMRVLLDHHRISITSIGAGDSGFGTDGWPAANPETGTYLWGGDASPRAYTPEGQWTTMWTTLATHFMSDNATPGITGAGLYASNPILKNVIVGFDPHNEPYNLKWSTWAPMCEALFPHVNAIAPDWMMFVEGVGASEDGTDTYWFGGYLREVATRPINLGAKQNKLAYNVHDYGQSVSAQTWLSSVATAGGTTTDSGGAVTGIYPALPDRTVANYPQNIEAIYDTYWGFIFTQGIAPIMVTEFGGGFGYDYATGAADPLQTSAAFEVQWLGALAQYTAGMRNDGASMLPVGGVGMSFAYFSLNPESGNPLGGLLLNSDYQSVQLGKIALLQTMLNN